MARHGVAFVGVGHSRVLRRDDVPLAALAREACWAAIQDAGLEIGDIDGIAAVPAQPFEIGHTTYDGRDFVSTNLMVRLLGLQPSWGENVDMMLIQSVVEASNAIEAGLCKYALVFRALQSPHGVYGGTEVGDVPGLGQLSVPYGVYNHTMFGQIWHRYADIHGGATREQMAAFVLQERRNGLMWEHGFWTQNRPTELSKADYLEGRIVSSPLSIYDCDIPMQCCGAFVLTSAELAADLKHPPAYIAGISAPQFPVPEGVAPITLDTERECGEVVVANLWRDSGLSLEDVSVAQLYDGFSIIAMLWLEAFGYCNYGEAFDLVQDDGIGLKSEQPVNTAGGSIGAGRTHGIVHVMESVLQVMGRSGARQVKSADVALSVVGPPSIGAALLLQA
jgi:acetyl-CoA acetyltransferase